MAAILARSVLRLAAFCAGLGIAYPAWPASTIDPTQPVSGQPYTSAPIRNNFQAAANDIYALDTCNAAATAPLSPGLWTCWLDTSAGPTGYVQKEWDGSVWVALGTLDTTIHQWSPVSEAGIIDPVTYGMQCNGADATAAVQSAVNALSANGGEVIIKCPITIAGTVTLGNSVRLTGIGSVFYRGMAVPPSTWPPTIGPAINCTSTTATVGCIAVAGIGDEIDHINFGNPQPAPPAPPASSGFSPVIYPPVIGTTNNSGWNGLHIHDVSFTSATNPIDLEGTPTYSTITGYNWTIDHVWCNACLGTGFLLHRLDNNGSISYVDFVPLWYGSYPSLGAYLRANAIGFDIKYAAAPIFENIQFFVNKIAIRFTNDTVTNNFGAITMAASAVKMANIDFNNSCQAMTLGSSGAGTVISAALTNVKFWADQTGFGCSNGKYLINLPTNALQLSISHASVYAADSFMSVGCGSGCSPGGSPNITLDDVAGTYSNYTAGQHFIGAPSNTSVVFAATNFATIVATTGAGTFMGPGADSTQGYMAPLCVGGGPHSLEGAACLVGSAAGNNSGSVFFYDPSNVEQAMVGAATSAGLNVQPINGSIYLNPVNGANVLQVGSSSNALTLINPDTSHPTRFTSTGGFVLMPTTSFTMSSINASALPGCSGSTNLYAMLIIKDLSTMPAYGATITVGSGGGTVAGPVLCNGTAWVAH